MTTPDPQADPAGAQPDAKSAIYETVIGYPPADTGPLQVLHSRMLEPAPPPEPDVEPEAEP